MQISPPTAVFRRDVAGLVFAMLLVSYVWFWQHRSWNDGSRLALTYSVVDRGTIRIDGLEHQTGDLSFREGHYYSDKPPGQALLGVPVYALLKVTGVSHPRFMAPIRYWWPDYVLTLATSATLTAVLAVLMSYHAVQLGCGQTMAAVIGLCYGLSTPAFTYATLFLGHQSAAAFGFASFALLIHCRQSGHWSVRRTLAAGVLAGYAVMTEYPMVFLCAALPIVALSTGCPLRSMTAYLAGAGVCAARLMAYHTAAFGAPFATGYSYEVHPEFRAIYTPENPTGLQAPTLRRALQILFSSHGLLWYAPIVVLAPLGLRELVRRKEWAVISAIVVAFGSCFLVNASHPTWTGGASTGPRYVQAALPFVMFLVAAAVAPGQRWSMWAMAALACAGYIVCVACTASPAGGRLPDYGTPGGENPLLQVALPDLLAGRTGRNLGNLIIHGSWDHYFEGNWASLAPLLAIQAALLFAIVHRCRQLHAA